MQSLTPLKGIRLTILFGSHAKARTRKRSDIDIAVLADHPLTLEEKMATGELLASQLHVSEENLDLVDLWQAPPLLQYEIARSGKLLSGDAFEFIRFKVLAVKRYYDTARFRRAREHVLNQYVQGGHTQKA